MPAWLALALGSALVLASSPSAQSSAPAPVQPSPRTIVLIVLDTTRLDEIGAYGGDHRVSPSLDGLATEGLTYSAAFSTDSLTSSSHLALFTGALTGDEQVPPKDSQMLAEKLKALGFRTIGVAANWVLDPSNGFNRGFDFFTNVVDPVTRDLVAKHDETDAEGRRQRATASAVSETLGKALRDVNASDSLFVFLNFLDPHDPYTPEPRYRRRFAPRVHVSGHLRAPDGSLSAFFAAAGRLSQRDREELRQLYRAEVAQADAGIGRVRAMMRELGRDAEALYVVTADHGELFGERGCWTHNVGLSEQEVHVPLIVRGPGIPQGRREDDTIGLADLSSAIAAYGSGRGWNPEHRRPLLYHHIYGVNDPTSDTFNRTDVVGYAETDWRISRSMARCRLYRRTQPYWEETSCNPDSGIAAELIARLNHEFRSKVGLARLGRWVTERPSAEWLKKLRSLGYLGK
jgi:hypothetical protein